MGSPARSQPIRGVVFITLVAFITRLAVVPLSILQINPYAQADAIGFGNTAAIMAQNLLSGRNLFLTPNSTTYETWGFFLFPFYLIPGPSAIYAHIFVVCLGSIAVYNVAVIAQGLHSRRAAIAAGLPLAVYPSIILTQGSLLREGAVLFCLTTVARVAISPGPRLSKRARATVVIVALTIVTLLRRENAPIYAIAVVSGAAIWYINSYKGWTVASLIGVISAIVASPYIYNGLLYLDELRSNRARGRTVYLPDISFTSWLTPVAFSWIGAGYFLFSPFPWMIGTTADFIVAIEGGLNLILFPIAILGFVQLRDRWTPSVITVAVAFSVGVVLYGFGTANVGTAVRHRPMFLWVIFLFSGVWLAERIEVKI